MAINVLSNTSALSQQRVFDNSFGPLSRAGNSPQSTASSLSNGALALNGSSIGGSRSGSEAAQLGIAQAKQSADSSARAQAATELSGAASIVNVAQSANDAVQGLVKQALSITTRLANGEVTDTTERSQLEVEISNILTQIDAVASAATANGQALNGSNAQSFAIGVGGDGDTASLTTVSIQSLSLSSDDLDINFFVGDATEFNAAAAKNALTTASSTLQSQSDALDNTRDSITNSINAFGSSRGVAEAETRENANRAESAPEDIATAVASNAAALLGSVDAERLDSARLSSLLADDSNNETEPRSESAEREVETEQVEPQREENAEPEAVEAERAASERASPDEQNELVAQQVEEDAEQDATPEADRRSRESDSDQEASLLA